MFDFGSGDVRERVCVLVLGCLVCGVCTRVCMYVRVKFLGGLVRDVYACIVLVWFGFGWICL